METPILSLSSLSAYYLRHNKFKERERILFKNEDFSLNNNQCNDNH